MKTIQFIIALKRMKYLGIKLTKVIDLYNENVNILLKEIKTDMGRYFLLMDWKK